MWGGGEVWWCGSEVVRCGGVVKCGGEVRWGGGLVVSCGGVVVWWWGGGEVVWWRGGEVTKVRSELGTLGMATIVELRVVRDCRKIADQKVRDE